VGRLAQVFVPRDREFFDLFEVIAVDVQIAECVDKVADFESAHVRDHVREQSVA